MPQRYGQLSAPAGDRGHVHHVTRAAGRAPAARPCGVWAHNPRQLCHDPACPAAGHRGRGGSVSGAAPGGRSVWLGQHRWNIGVVRAAAMEHRCRCGPGRPGPCGADGVCGARLARARRAGEPGGAMMRRRPRAWWHPDPGDGAWGHAPHAGRAIPTRKRQLTRKRGVGQIPSGPASSVRRLVIEATVPA